MGGHEYKSDGSELDMDFRGENKRVLSRFPFQQDRRRHGHNEAARWCDTVDVHRRF